MRAVNGVNTTLVMGTTEGGCTALENQLILLSQGFCFAERSSTWLDSGWSNAYKDSETKLNACEQEDSNFPAHTGIRKRNRVAPEPIESDQQVKPIC